MEKFTLEDYNRLKKIWLKNISLNWLIQGHLTKDDALKMVHITEESL